MKAVELLAPAKDLTCGLTAINCGADAVYLGAARFGAREHAANALADIEQLSQYAHRYWARVYVTLNTLLTDAELPEAVQLCWQLYQAGVDALIIQDVGLLECDLPPLPLIASTQMHNHTAERIAFLEQVGFQRVILARELSLDEIRAIRAQTRLELECFIHGALCVGYSGQCYLSYALGGRSGNRGQCAQPCRRRYKLVDAAGQVLHDRYLLSLKDLNLAEHLADLLAAGVTAFKIEGRLKDQTYVANVVGYYRRQLDALLPAANRRRSSSGASYLDFTPDLNKTFNRGYTTYCVTGLDAPPPAALDTPKMKGEPVGRVARLCRGGVELEAPADLHNGDGLCYFDAAGELRGTVVNSVRGQQVFPDKPAGLRPGQMVYRNHDQAFLQRLLKSRTHRAVAVRLKFTETPEGFCLQAVDEDGVQADCPLNMPKTPARQPDLALANLRKQLSKTGGSGFICTEVELALAAPPFLPVAALNALRRQALTRLAARREELRPRPAGGAERNAAPYPEPELSYRGNVLNRQAEAFYRRHGVSRIAPAAESGLDLHGRAVLTAKYCLKRQFGQCARAGGAAPVAAWAEPVYLVDEAGQRFRLSFDCAQCEMQLIWEK